MAAQRRSEAGSMSIVAIFFVRLSFVIVTRR